MKKKLVGLIFGVMGFMLVACAPQDKEKEGTKVGVQESAGTEAGVKESAGAEAGAKENAGTETGVKENEDTEAGAPEMEGVVSDAPEDGIYEGMGIPNPWVDSDRAGVLEATGFDLVAPTGAANVVYSYMPSAGMAQMNYTMENAMWVYRVQPTEALQDISGIYCEWDYIGETKIAGMDAMEYGYASEPEGDFLDDVVYTRVINWYDAQNKVTYSISIVGTGLNGMDTAVYVESLLKEAKGFKETDLYQSFLGLHVSSYDGSEIMVEEDGENGRLKINVSLFRLCSLDDGVGIYENGMVRFDSTDPSGNLIRCCLFYNSDNSLCMKVEESTWEYLPIGTVIYGFDN